jgi:hypothetical protein
MNNDDLACLHHLLRRSRYDILQSHVGGCWSTPLSFAPCDPLAAEQAATMMCRLLGAGVYKVRHARRARLRMRSGDRVEAVVITILPDGTQVVLRLEDGTEIRGLRLLSDASLEAIRAVLGQSTKSPAKAAQ